MVRVARRAIVLAAVAALGAGLCAAASPAAQAAPLIGRASPALSPDPSSTINRLYGVSAVSGSDAWAVGYDVRSRTNALILHRNGTAWTSG